METENVHELGNATNQSDAYAAERKAATDAQPFSTVGNDSSQPTKTSGPSVTVTKSELALERLALDVTFSFPIVLTMCIVLIISIGIVVSTLSAHTYSFAYAEFVSPLSAYMTLC